MIIVGLGNPDPEHRGTRHNLGFRVVDRLATNLGLKWKTEHGVAWCQVGDTVLCKPLEYMNVSGSTLKKFFGWKHWPLELDQLLVIHDDLDLPLGTIKPDVDRSSGGHLGVASIIDALGSQAFRRLRLGVGSNRELNIPAEDYVLQHIPTADEPAIDATITAAVEQLANQAG